MDKISTENLELDISRKEYNLGFDKTSDKEKIYSMLSQGDDMLVRWHQEGFKSKNVNDLSYET